MLALWWPAKKQKSACQAVPIQEDHLEQAPGSLSFSQDRESHRIFAPPRSRQGQVRNPSLSKGTQPNAAAMPRLSHRFSLRALSMLRPQWWQWVESSQSVVLQMSKPTVDSP